MKRADVILGVSALLICALWLGGRTVLKKDGVYVIVEQNGELYGRYALEEDQEIDIGSGNHISIRDGTVRMTSADCPDHICIRQGRISAEGAAIICLPNRVTVQVAGNGTQDLTTPDAPDMIAY